MSVILSILLFSAVGQPKPMPSKPLSFTIVTTSLESKQIPEVGAVATVLVFMTVDCPIANRYSPEIIRLANEFAGKKVAFYRVYVDTSVKPDAIDRHGKEFKYPCPAFVDTKHAVVNAIGATVTPEAAVLDSKGMLRYRGRIDDRYVEHGKPPKTEYRRDLREAIVEVLAGKEVSVKQLPAIGCSIPEIEN